MARKSRIETVEDISPEQGWVSLKAIYAKDGKGKVIGGKDKATGVDTRTVRKYVWYGEAPIVRQGEKATVSATVDAPSADDVVSKRACCKLLDDRVEEARKLATLWARGVELEAGESIEDAMVRMQDERDGRTTKKRSPAPTLEQYWNDWIAHQRVTNRRRTVSRYTYHWEHQMAPHAISKMPLDAIDTAALKRWYAWLAKLPNERKPDQLLADGTRKNAVALLRTIMREAYSLRCPKTKEKWLDAEDVVKEARLMSGQPIVRRSKVAALGGNDPSVLDGFFGYFMEQGDTAENRRTRTLLALLRLGLRPSEALAVRREDITFNEAFGCWQVNVDKQVDEIKDEAEHIVGYNTNAPTKRSKTGYAYCPEWLSEHLLATREIELRDREQVRSGPRGGKAWVTTVKTVEPAYAIPAIRTNERNRGMEHCTTSYIADAFGKVAEATGLPDAYPYLMRAQLHTELSKAEGLSDKGRARAMRQSRVLDDNYHIESEAELARAMLGVKRGA